MSSTGWLTEDGVLDEQAAWMAANHRVPALTQREAMLAVFYMMKQGKGSKYISRRLNISLDRASAMIKSVRDEKSHLLPRKAHADDM